MNRTGAWIGTTVFLFVAPGVVAGLVPWLLTGYEAGSTNAVLLVVGWLLVVSGAAALLSSFARFAVEGRGTPAPVAPTDALVVGGLYRFVRNPMYIAVVAVILGQASILARPVLVTYAAVILAMTATFVRIYEEPTLSERYGAEYDAYRGAVRGWWPRIRPWRG
jgi:protein-S-isoprenylcysteine O-methyltransferase Ste14